MGEMAEEFEKLTLIGEGSFGKAWLARCKKSNDDRAIKQIKLDRLSPKDTELALTEVTVLSRCRHPNIIAYFQAFVEDGHLNIVMEYAKYGDLQKRLESQNGVHLDKEVILGWFTQICFALKYIHKQNILHRDLKTPNIFVCGSNLLKLGDFGIARLLDSDKDQAMTTIGTPYYFSPEICNRKPYNYKSDMWAAGCVLYEMCCFHVPFIADDYVQLVMKITKSQCKPIPTHFGPLIEDLIGILLKPEPEDRPSCEELLAIPAIQPHVDAYLHKQRLQSEKRQSITSPTIISGIIKNRCTPMAKPPSRDKENNEPIGDPNDSPKPTERDTPTKLGLLHTKQIQRLKDVVYASPKSIRPLSKGLTTKVGFSQPGPTPVPKMSLLKEMQHKAHMTGIPSHVYTTAGTPAARRSSVPALFLQRKSSIALSMSGLHRPSSSSNPPSANRSNYLLSQSSVEDQSINSSLSDSSGVFLTEDEVGLSADSPSLQVTESDKENSDDGDSDSDMELDARMKKFASVDKKKRENSNLLEVPSNEVDMKSDGDDYYDDDNRLEVVEEEEEAESGELDMNNNEADLELEEVDYELNEIFEVFYQSALCTKDNPQKCSDNIQTFLEEKYGFERFFRLQNKIKESIEYGIPVAELSMDLTCIEKLYMPMMFHLLTLENIELRLRGVHISSESS